MAAAARRSITAGASIITRRFCPSCFHLLLPNHSTSNDEISKSQPQPQPQLPSHFKPTTNFFHLDPFARFYSSSSSSSSDELGFISDVAEVLKDPTTEIASSVVKTVPISFPGEVAAAAADSAFPVAALQHVIDFVHSTTGFNWWASIALTTLLIRGATVPLMLNQMKASYKLAAMRPEMEEFKERMGNVKEMDPAEMMENQKKMKALFKKHGVSPFSPLKGLLIQGPVFISFFFAISNMVEKVPSFKAGGAFWFTDLTTPDPFYALPILTGLTFLATVELNVQEGMEGNPMAGTMKKFSRGMAVMTVPFTAQFPKAIFCYWITSNLFSLAYGSVMKQKRVRQFLKLPDMNQAPTNPSTPHSSGMFSFFDGQKSIAAPITDETKEPSKVPERRISSSTVISQKIRNLEKQVKSRNSSKTKRR